MSPWSSPGPSLTYDDGSTPRVCIIGAGLSGICAAAQLKRKLNLETYVLYEKADDVGGAWLANSYPGCQVDVPAWVYSYSFEQKPSWSQMCPDRDEMLAYIKGVAKKYGIYSRVQFETEVRSAVWNETTAIWSVTTAPVDTKEETVQEFDILIIGTGMLREPNCPTIFDTFTGPKIHSARWDSDLNLEGRVVGVIGSSSSAIQVVPSIAPKVKKLIVYMREPPYLILKPQLSLGRMASWIFTLFPFLLWIIRGIFFVISESLVSAYNSGSLIGKVVRVACRARLRRNVRSESSRQQLTPNHSPGYKLPAAGYACYYQAFNLRNVELNRSPIRACKGSTIVTEDGRADSLDVLILCTGFKPLDFFAPMRIVGENGVNLLDLWKESRPDTFCGVTCHAAPNLFFLLGPNGTAGTNGAMFSLECQVNFVINAIRALMTRNAVSIRVKSSAQAEFMAEVSEAAKKKVYMQPQPAGTCVGGTWLVNENGFPLLWPKSSTRYWLRTRRLDPSKFEFTSRPRPTPATSSKIVRIISKATIMQNV